MPDIFTPALTTTDWNEEWKALQKARRHADDASYWDERAKTFTTKDAPNPYVDRFLELTGVQPGESVFDMGCGTGALAVPLGQAGHTVVAADFSAGMLSHLHEELASRNITCVKTIQMSWEDNWEDFGVEPKSADVCTASRSIATDDLRSSLLKLSTVARRRVAITLPTGASPRTDNEMLTALGLSGHIGRDYLYALNILANLGFEPELNYIKSARNDSFDSRDEAITKFGDMVRKSAPFVEQGRLQAALEALPVWVDAQLESNPEAGKPDKKGVAQGRLRMKNPRIITWAHIAWNLSTQE